MLRLTATLLVACIVLLAGCDSAGPEPDPPAQANQAPTASAAVTASEVEEGETVQLDGSDSSDPDGDALTFTWTLERPDGSEADLSDADDPAPSFVADVSGDYVATLSVSDGQADDSDEVSVTANPCAAQLIESDIQTDVVFSTVCSGDEAFDYIVTGPIDINATATFEAGLRVGFEEEAGLRVNNGGALLAKGTVEEVIELTQACCRGEVLWRGIHFRSEDRTSELEYVNVNYAGHAENWTSETAAITVGNDASLSMVNSSIDESGGYGLYVETRGTLSSFDDVAILNTASAPIRIPDKQMGAIGGNVVFGGNADEYIEVYATIGISEDLVLVNRPPQPARVPFRMDGFFEVNAEVTVEPGVRMTFTPGSAIRVNDGGRILADGTEEAPIVMENAEELPVGNWRGVLFRAPDLTSRLNHVEVIGGGSEAWSLFDVKAAVSVDNDARLELRNSLIDTYFLTNTYALAVQDRGELLNFENTNRLVGSGEVPDYSNSVDIYIPDRQLGFRDAAFIPYTGEGYPGLYSAHVYATIGIDEPITVTIPEVEGALVRFPYIMDGAFEVNASLTIRRESTDDFGAFRFTEGSSMRVNDGGALLTDSSSPNDSLFVFRGVNPGYWQGLLFRADDRMSELDGVRVIGGGREAWPLIDDPANISVQNSRLTLTNSEIIDSAGWGVVLDGGRTVFNGEGNTYEGNALGAVGADE